MSSVIDVPAKRTLRESITEMVDRVREKSPSLATLALVALIPLMAGNLAYSFYWAGRTDEFKQAIKERFDDYKADQEKHLRDYKLQVEVMRAEVNELRVEAARIGAK